MKLIANTLKGFMVEVTYDELAQLQGYDSYYSDGFNKLGINLNDEIDLGKIVNTAKYVRTLDAEVLEQSHDRLLKMANRLNDVRDLVVKLNLFDKLSAKADNNKEA